MVTTLRLQQLGYQCVLIEKSDRLGGIMKYGGNYSQLYVDEDATFTNTNDLIQDHLLDTVTWQKKILAFNSQMNIFPAVNMIQMY